MGRCRCLNLAASWLPNASSISGHRTKASEKSSAVTPFSPSSGEHPPLPSPRSSTSTLSGRLPTSDTPWGSPAWSSCWGLLGSFDEALPRWGDGQLGSSAPREPLPPSACCRSLALEWTRLRRSCITALSSRRKRWRYVVVTACRSWSLLHTRVNMRAVSAKEARFVVEVGEASPSSPARRLRSLGKRASVRVSGPARLCF